MIYFLATDIKEGEYSQNKYMLVTDSNYISRSLYKVTLQMIKINRKLQDREIRWMSKSQLKEYL